MLLSILICSLKKRQLVLLELLSKLKGQMKNTKEVEIIVAGGDDVSVGEKRNKLLEKAEGKYLCFIDDDDDVCDNYIELVLDAIKHGPDCCSLTGEITTNGADAKTFIHSIRYDSYFEKDGIYYRPPNHLNVIKSEIAKQFKFPEKNFGEDTDWAMQICKSKLLKKEIWIEPTLYHYKYISNK